MGVLVSVLTPDWLIHVTDTGDAQPHTIAVTGPLVTGLVSVAAPAGTSGWVTKLTELAELSPPAGAELLRAAATRRFDALRTAGQLTHAASRATLLFTGWGHHPHQGRVAFRYTVTNHEHPDAGDDVGVDGVTLRFETYGQDVTFRTQTQDVPYSIVIAGTREPRLRRQWEAIPRAVRKGGAEAAVEAAAALVRAAAALPDAGVGDGLVIARLLGDGTSEAAVLGGRGGGEVALPRLTA